MQIFLASPVDERKNKMIPNVKSKMKNIRLILAKQEQERVICSVTLQFRSNNETIVLYLIEKPDYTMSPLYDPL